jgi:nucleoside phosphorylase
VPVPHFDGKHLHEALYQPGDVIARWAALEPLPPVPPGIVFCWDSRLLDGLIASGAREIPWRPMRQCRLYSLPGTDVLTSFQIGWGAPSASYVFELLIALGVRRFVIAGTAGGLGDSMHLGDTVLVDRAIRDEGVSHHYLAPGQYSYPNADLTAALGRELASAGIVTRSATTWTIDAVFRETAAEARHHAANGALAVEMEAAALFAIAQVRKVEIGAALVMSDRLLDDRHVPPDPALYLPPLRQVFDAGVRTLST